MQTSSPDVIVQVPSPPAAPPAPTIVRGANGGSVVVYEANPSQGGFAVPTVGSGPGGIPMTATEMRALRAQRTELSNQLISAADRRKSLVRELTATGPVVARQGLEARIRVLDDRIVELEKEIARTGRLVMMAPANLQGLTSEQRVDVSGNNEYVPSDGAIISISIVFTLAVLMPLAITAARIWWRRANGKLPARQQKADTDRMERLEGAVETIAIEMERVSEGQRFMTRILTEGRGEVPVFGANAARGEAVRIPAGGESGA